MEHTSTYRLIYFRARYTQPKYDVVEWVMEKQVIIHITIIMYIV